MVDYNFYVLHIIHEIVYLMHIFDYAIGIAESIRALIHLKMHYKIDK